MTEVTDTVRKRELKKKKRGWVGEGTVCDSVLDKEYCLYTIKALYMI